MGLIPMTGFCKIAEGAQNDPNGNPILDDRSIQNAIRGTLANSSLANVGNFSALNALARLDMFVPKRFGAAQQASDYRGFPRPTIINVSGYQETYTAGGDLLITFVININNKVGYSIPLNFDFQVGASLDPPSGGAGLGLEQPVFTLLAGDTSVICSFIRTTVPNITSWSVNFTGSGFALYDSQVIVNRSGVANNTPVNRVQWTVISTDFFACSNQVWDDGLITPVNHWTPFLAMGELVYTTEGGSTFVPNGIYNFGSVPDPNFNTSGTIYRVESGEIVEIIGCTYPPSN